MSSPDVAGMTTRPPRLARTHTVSASAADARRGAGDDGGERGEVRLSGHTVACSMDGRKGWREQRCGGGRGGAWESSGARGDGRKGWSGD